MVMQHFVKSSSPDKVIIPSGLPKSAMADRPGKIARIQSLRSRLPYVSQSALSQILRFAAEEPEMMPGSCSRKDIRQARDDAVAELTPYGPLHQTLTLASSTGEATTLEIQHPFAMLWYACAKSKSFSDLVVRTLASNPGTLTEPWSLVMYADEILPGNQLAYKNARKMWGIYWTMLNFGSAALSDEDRIVVIGMYAAASLMI